MKKFLFPSLTAFFVLIGAIGSSVMAASETRDLNAFSSIGVAISADVYYTPGSTHEIRIEGDARDVEDLITEVKNGRLSLKYENWKIKRSKLTIYVSSMKLDGVNVSGSAKFKSDEELSAEEMGIALSGSGRIQFARLDAEEIEVKISGSGNAILQQGAAEEMDVKISGSGKLDAERFEVQEFDASISGSGSCKITVHDELDARMSGSGGVYYHGNPVVNSVSSGSGKIRSL